MATVVTLKCDPPPKGGQGPHPFWLAKTPHTIGEKGPRILVRPLVHACEQSKCSIPIHPSESITRAKRIIDPPIRAERNLSPAHASQHDQTKLTPVKRPKPNKSQLTCDANEKHKEANELDLPANVDHIQATEIFKSTEKKRNIPHCIAHFVPAAKQANVQY